MDIFNLLIQVLFWIPFVFIFLDIFHQMGLEEFVCEEFERIWLGDCTPVNYFQFSLEDLEPDEPLPQLPTSSTLPINLAEFLELDTNPLPNQ